MNPEKYKLISERVEALLAQMTLREKIGQLNQAGSTMTCTLPGFEANIDTWLSDMLEGRLPKAEFKERMAMCQEDLREEEIIAGELGNFVNLYDDEKVARVQALAMEKSRLGIPLFIGVDAVRGYRTMFPTPLALSCSWDMGVVRAAAETGRKEAVVSGVNWTFGPMLDVARDARWGRIVEAPGEDPLLAGEYAKAQITAYQDCSEGNGLLATAKHFVAYGAASGGQDYNTVDMSKRVLYDTYLPPFRAAIEAGVGCVMSAFHDFDGVPCTMNKELLTDILRKEMGFDGFVVSDAEAVKQCVTHGTARDEKDAAKASLLAGGDMDMSSLDYVRFLEELIKDGEISERDVDRAADRVLFKKIEYGLFEREYHYDKAKIERTILCPEHRSAALEAGKRSAVLLKNDGVLPVGSTVRNILLVGELADNKDALMGPWSFTGRKDAQVTIRAGMENGASGVVKIIISQGLV